MNTSAPKQQPKQQPSPRVVPQSVTTFEGVVVSNAQVRMKPIDREGHMVPVLCVDIIVAGPLRNLVHLEQPFAPDAHDACEAAARRYHKGLCIKADAPTVGLRMLVPNVSHIHVQQSEERSA